MTRILLLIVLCTVINANSVECYDGNKWRKIPKEVLYNNGIDPFNLLYKEDCKEAYRLYKKVSSLSSKNNNKAKNTKNNITNNNSNPSASTAQIAKDSPEEDQKYWGYIVVILFAGLFVIKRLRRKPWYYDKKRYYKKLLGETKDIKENLKADIPWYYDKKRYYAKIIGESNLAENHQDEKILSEPKILEENHQDNKEYSSYDGLLNSQKKSFTWKYGNSCEKHQDEKIFSNVYSGVKDIEEERQDDRVFSELRDIEEDHQELSYDDLLKSPKWKSFRKYILQKRGSICERCHDPYSKPLNIHHRYYLYDDNGKYLPWEYSYKAMLVLCKNCHDTVHRTIRIRSYYRHR